ncbi:MAG: hypothetical protein Harvfovirus4_37 [Harvfovirus sp.]|uniref:Aspartic peptidase DDI1-type domain-containing protein n=1 Tax=Harvfovirus sp. TaxID=2487768 RepID=A0A3G5A4C2_9VIRU|nr:MAG: hypothetical protein Harvfovirus4_37 [Harvfovirus sp.]
MAGTGGDDLTELELAEAIQRSLDVVVPVDVDIEDDMKLATAIETSLQPAVEAPVVAADPNLFLDNLWAMAEDNIDPMLRSKCQINVLAKIADKEVTLIIDTGAQVNVMSMDVVKKLGIVSFMDTRSKGTMHGVGTGTICGQIPYIEIKFGDVLCPANFYVLENMKDQHLQILIGFPFMMFYKTNLDFAKSQMTIGSYKVNMIIKEF